MPLRRLGLPPPWLRRTLAVAALAAFGAVTWATSAAGAAGAERVYYIEGPLDATSIDYANADGSGTPQTLNTTGASTPLSAIGLAIDPQLDRIYWANKETGTISWASLAGTGGGDLNISGATVDDAIGVAVDPANGRIYWANYAGNQIDYANADGSGGGGVLATPGATVDGPNGLAVDPSANRIYWVNYVGSVAVSWAALDGSGGGDLNTGTATDDGPYGVAYNPGDGRLYWSNYSDGVLSYARADVAGLGGNLSSSSAGAYPIGVAVEPGSERLYYGATGGVYWAPLVGSGGGTVASASFASWPVIVDAPVAAGAPKISGGATTGSRLTCSSGSWAADQASSFYYRSPFTYTYTWTLNGGPVAGGPTVTTRLGNVIGATAAGTYACTVTGANPAGSATQTSAGFKVKAAPAGSTGSTGSTSPTGSTGSSGPNGASSFKGVALTSQSVRLTRRGAAPIRIGCPAGTPGGCTGTLALRIRIAERGHRHAARTLTLGTHHFAITAGRARTVDVELSSAGRGRVRAARHGLACTATATSADRLGATATRAARVVVHRHRG
jgi:hypothetical protein